jgi:hypothetical protein
LKNTSLLFILFFLLPLLGLAQEPSVLSAASPGWSLLASKPKGDFDTLKIPIKRADNLILIEAEVDGIRGNFIFDTGAPGLVLNTAYFRQQAIRKNRTSVGVAGTSTEVYEMQVKQLSIQELYFDNMIVELTELSHIENNKGIKIIGLLGTALFEDLLIKLDIRKSMMYLTKSTKEPHKTLIPNNALQVNFSYLNNSIFIPMKIGKYNLNICFDTGAEVMVLDNYLPKGVMKNVQLSKRLNLSGTGGQKLEVWSGSLSNLSIAKQNWPETKVIIAGLQELGQAYGQTLDGIIGFSLLEKGIVEINIRKKQMTLYLYEENRNE